ncbi:MAG: AMP-binding protein [Bacteroidales bacterium]
MSDSNSATRHNFLYLLKEIETKYAELPALAFVDEKPITYSELGQKVRALCATLKKLNIDKGDRVSIMGTNSPNWGIAYLATVISGSIVVPILPDFSEEEVTNVLMHSGAKAIFVSNGLKQKIRRDLLPELKCVIDLEPFRLDGCEEVIYDEKIGCEPKEEPDEDDVAALLYTSGTTGKSKGVMLTHRNICWTARQCLTIEPISTEYRMLSVLPLAHTYENTIGFVLPLIGGATIYYLSKKPTPQVLLPALATVKPVAMLTVPLIIEKIYKNKIKPAFRKNALLRMIYKTGPGRKLLHRMAGRSLKKTFGGQLRFFGIGGARLNAEVEAFLIEAGFPLAIGYGLTETSPLLAGSNPRNHRLHSTGFPMQGVTLKIHNPDPHTGEGEIWAQGPNVMKGYYKEPGLTAEVLTPDGWFRTGDLGVFDKDGYLYIKGRSKNVIIGPHGENIYPEDIESVLNNYPHVLESLVMEDEGKLIALVHLDTDAIRKKLEEAGEEIKHIEEKIQEHLRAIHADVNKRISRNARIQQLIHHAEPFHKTATQKIKRFLYGKHRQQPPQTT